MAKNQELFSKKISEQVLKAMEKEEITKEKLFRIRQQILNSLLNNKRKTNFQKIGSDEKFKLNFLKNSYNNLTNNSELINSLIKLNKNLLESKNIQTKFEALKEIEKIRKKYGIDAYEERGELVKQPLF